VKLSEFMITPALAGDEFLARSWTAWRIVAMLLDGEPLPPKATELAKQLTGRTTLPGGALDELFLGCGRGSGKSRFAAVVGTWLGSQDYRDRLAPGETAIVFLVAPTTDQAKVLFGYIQGLIQQSAILSAEVTATTTDSIDFRHRSRIEVATSSFRTVRGRTLVGAILDEVAFLRSDSSALPDLELYRALLPALNRPKLKGRLIALSSPHRKVGLMYDAYKRYHGNDDAGRELYIQAASSLLNPTYDQAAIDRAITADPEAALSEYGGQFRNDLAGYLTEELLAACLEPRTPGRRRSLFAFADLSGGVHDSAALALAHGEDAHEFQRPPRLVLDALIHIPAPHEPQAAVEQFVKVLRDYNLTTVTGDRYAATWPISAFQKFGITYEQSELSASEIYAEMLPAFSERRVTLLDDERLLTELRMLERKPRAGNRTDSTDHPRGGHDDCAIAACGALLIAAGSRGFDGTVWERCGMDTGTWTALTGG